MINQTLATIAKDYAGIETLETRNADALDFHDVHAATMKDALTAAYLAGYAAAGRAAKGSKADQLPPDLARRLG